MIELSTFYSAYCNTMLTTPSLIRLAMMNSTLPTQSSPFGPKRWAVTVFFTPAYVIVTWRVNC